MLTRRVALGLMGVTAWVVATAAPATVTGLTFAGGCPEGACAPGNNPSVSNVAEILGVDTSYVTQIGSDLDSDGSGDGFAITGIDQQGGNWSVSDSSITHLTFKANGYFIIGKVADTSGMWDADVLEWVPDFTTLDCPASICGSVRAYTLADFRTGAMNTSIADLSNVRAFSVVPIPAAAWLFVTALAGLFGLKRFTSPSA